MGTATVQSNLVVAGLLIRSQLTRQADGLLAQELTLPAGKAGSLTTRTDANTGVATLASGHGITTSDQVDVYWADGLRYGMTVTAADATTVSIDGGAGDDLPVAATALVVSVRVQIDVGLDGDALAFLAAHCDRRAHVEFQDSGPATLHAQELAAGEAWVWADQGATNPLAGEVVAAVYATSGEAAAAAVKLAALVDVTP